METDAIKKEAQIVLKLSAIGDEEVEFWDTLTLVN
jgi:hypothetical protein